MGHSVVLVDSPSDSGFPALFVGAFKRVARNYWPYFRMGQIKLDT
jgi:hypothetical protein